MADNTVDYLGLTTKAQILLTDLMALSDKDGVLHKKDLQSFVNFFSTTSGVDFKGKLLIADTAVEGWYFAGESGIFTIGGVSKTVTLANNLTIIIVPNTAADWTLVELPVSISLEDTTYDVDDNVNGATMKLTSDYFTPLINGVDEKTYKSSILQEKTSTLQYTSLTVPSSTTDSYFYISGGVLYVQSSAPGWKRNSVNTESSMYDVSGENYIAFSGVIDASGNGDAVGIVFLDTSLNVLGYGATEQKTYTNEIFELPTGTTRVTTCSYGDDATVSIIDATLLSAKLDVDFATDIATAQTTADDAQTDADTNSEDINTLELFNESIEPLFTVESYYEFNGVDSEIDLSSEIQLNQVGDYIETYIRNNQNVPSSGSDFQSQYLFGRQGEFDNTLGYYALDGTVTLRIRVDSGSFVEFSNTENIDFSKFHKIKFLISATDTWQLYIDDVLIDTVSATSLLRVDNVGNVSNGGDVFCLVDIEYYNITAGGVSYNNSDLANANGIYTPSNITYYNNTSINDQFKDAFYTVDPTGSNSSDELVTIYTKIKDSVYQKTPIHHMVNATSGNVNSIRPYTDLWRIYGAEETIYNPVTNTFSDTGRVILHTSENEFAFYQDGSTDHTGGWHGYEELINVYIKIDGKTLDTSVTVSEPTECFKAEIMQYSKMYDHGNYPTIAAYHSKLTTLEVGGGYDTVNTLDAVIALPDGWYYAGLSCVGTGIGNSAWVNDFVVRPALEDDSTTIMQEGKDSTIWYSKSGSSYSVKVTADFNSVLISGTETKDTWNQQMDSELFDRSTDYKYYRRNRGNLSLGINDYFQTHLKMEITYK